jgi:rhodanese-related sulfurtransferase
VKHILLEALLVSTVGASLAFAANRLSPRGLDLARNYFPEPSRATVSNPAPANAAATNAPSPLDLVKSKLLEAGLQLATTDDVKRLFRDPRREQGLIVFLDAREDEPYEAGHIPGAYQFDYYHAEKFLGTILPLCQATGQVVIYCNGGDCEDSLRAAMLLGNDAGVPKSKLFVYGGGITEWTEEGQPVETGARDSGKFVKPAK